MSITSEIEEKFKLKIEDFNDLEKATYFEMLDNIQKSQLTPERLRDYIIAMRDAVEAELIKEPEYKTILIFKVRNDKNILLKARLQNYRLLEAFLISPEKAKQQLEDMIASFTQRR